MISAHARNIYLLLFFSIFCFLFFVIGAESLLKSRETEALRKEIEIYVKRQGVQFDKYKEIIRKEVINKIRTKSELPVNK